MRTYISINVVVVVRVSTASFCVCVCALFACMYIYIYIGGCFARVRWRVSPFRRRLNRDKDTATATTATTKARHRQPHLLGERHRAGHRNDPGQRPLPKILAAHLRPRAERTRRQEDREARRGGGPPLRLTALVGTERSADIPANSPPISQLLRPPHV